MIDSELKSLRARAIAQALFEPTSLRSALKRLAFVQADPIRSPARAQDLILRHRVKGYRAGDLERHYPSLDLEEDILYAYGFLPREICRLLHPRPTAKLSKLEKTVLDTVLSLGVAHPKELATSLGRKRVVNAWGGHSSETTRALDRLHYRGYLRVAGRDNGIRTFEATKLPPDEIAGEDRLRALIKVIAKVLGPVSDRTLYSTLGSFRRNNPKLNDIRVTLAHLLESAELICQRIDGVSYIFPPSKHAAGEPPRKVKILAPFDPLVWDRKRFAHFWGWEYRFEAYTPSAKRLRGYYAMPLLWMDLVVGWANVRVVDGRMQPEIGFIDKRPRETDFRSQLDDEISRMEKFLL